MGKKSIRDFRVCLQVSNQIECVLLLQSCHCPCYSKSGEKIVYFNENLVTQNDIIYFNNSNRNEGPVDNLPNICKTNIPPCSCRFQGHSLSHCPSSSQPDSPMLLPSQSRNPESGPNFLVESVLGRDCDLHNRLYACTFGVCGAPHHLKPAAEFYVDALDSIPMIQSRSVDSVLEKDSVSVRGQRSGIKMDPNWSIDCAHIKLDHLNDRENTDPDIIIDWSETQGHQGQHRNMINKITPSETDNFIPSSVYGPEYEMMSEEFAHTDDNSETNSITRNGAPYLHNVTHSDRSTEQKGRRRTGCSLALKYAFPIKDEIYASSNPFLAAHPEMIPHWHESEDGASKDASLVNYRTIQDELKKLSEKVDINNRALASLKKMIKHEIRRKFELPWQRHATFGECAPERRNSVVKIPYNLCTDSNLSTKRRPRMEAGVGWCDIREGGTNPFQTVTEDYKIGNLPCACFDILLWTGRKPDHMEDESSDQSKNRVFTNTQNAYSPLLPSQICIYHGLGSTTTSLDSNLLPTFVDHEFRPVSFNVIQNDSEWQPQPGRFIFEGDGSIRTDQISLEPCPRGEGTTSMYSYDISTECIDSEMDRPDPSAHIGNHYTRVIHANEEDFVREIEKIDNQSPVTYIQLHAVEIPDIQSHIDANLNIASQVKTHVHQQLLSFHGPVAGNPILLQRRPPIQSGKLCCAQIKTIRPYSHRCCSNENRYTVEHLESEDIHNLSIETMSRDGSIDRRNHPKSVQRWPIVVQPIANRLPTVSSPENSSYVLYQCQYNVPPDTKTASKVVIIVL